MSTVLSDPTEELETMTLQATALLEVGHNVCVCRNMVPYEKTTKKEVKSNLRGCVQQPRMFIYSLGSFRLSSDNTF